MDFGGIVSSCDGSLGLEDTSSNCFPFLRVMTLAFSLGFMMVWEGSLPDPLVLIWLISLAIWPIWYSKFFWDMAKVLTMIHPKEYIYLTLHLEISVDKYGKSKGRVLRDWVLIYNLLVYLLVSKKTKKKGI